MPLYLYQHIDTEEVREVLQGMNDVHEYHGEDDEEKGKWKRVFTKPNMAMDSQSTDPFSQKEFRKATDKNMTVGEAIDLSEELSRERERINGVDPVKEKFAKKYKEKTGKDNPNLKPRTFESDKVKVEYDS